jgi:branched-chain amino acid transport system ATP-binding protein
MTRGAPLLAVSGLVVRYGAVTAVREVALHVDEGEIVSIVGPNGAGKTSLILTVAGIIAPAAGTVIFADTTLSGIALEDVVAHGIALVPEGRHIFASLTVMENLLLGATVRRDSRAVAADLDRFFAMFPILAERRRQPAGQLSGGEQQQLAIARALLSRPRLLMLDEPSLGLAPMVVDQIYALLATIRAQGVTILLVEQNAERVFGIANRVYVMSGGVCSRRRRSRNQKPSALRRRLFRRAHARIGKRTVMERLVQILADAVSVGSLYALTALGIGLIFGVMRLINFARGELITFAAYTLLALFGQPVLIMIFGGIAVAVVLALVTERAAFRPLRNADPTTLLSPSPSR